MKILNARLLGIVLLLALVAAILGLAVFTGGSNDHAPRPALAALPAPSAPLPAVVEPTPVAPAAPVAIPPAIKKIAAAARATPLNRPMNRVIKSWLGCHDKQVYLDTMALLSRNDPAVAAQFKGDQPSCVMLAEGQKVSVVSIDQEDHLVQAKIQASGDPLWIDPSALDGPP